ncbi:hypothetical protein [Halomonas sp. N3-2A]|uniref:hypothetical protein n=1 Tax=Halomonas sp. N3-2A TaxID=2014541 RepID=UPI000B5B1EBD|nr:hypothetical protein [Halomonas sp. N3-2A]ASK18424.1 hypothetical protein CEK60_03470 [Halomonas sp. N3-2A]
MKERPILFNAAMVRAILNGHKTQTRRAIKLKTGDTFDEHALSAAIQEWRPMYDEVAQKVVGKTAALIRCPYGQPGDRLWVRETFQGPLVDQEEMEKDPTYFKDMGRYKNPEHCAYRASGDSCEYVDQDGDLIQRWKPSIHMPRWASRITLEIVSVRVERLLSISDEDAIAEGCYTNDEYSDMAGEADVWPCQICDGYQVHEQGSLAGASEVDCHSCDSPKKRFNQLWQSINGFDRRDANPWVWVVEFRRVDQ